MKFQIISNQNGNKQEEVPKEQERISGARSENATVTEQKEDSYVKKSYLVAKAENGTLYVKNMLPDTGFSEQEIIETAEKFLETKKHLEVMKITGKIIAPLEEANRLQKEFVLFAGHELKTPVTVMKASLDMLEREVRLKKGKSLYGARINTICSDSR